MHCFMIRLSLITLLTFAHLLTADEEVKSSTLAEKVALGNDWLIQKGDKSPIVKPLTSSASRIMSVTVFPLCTAVDIAILAGKQVRETPYIILNKNVDKHRGQIKKNHEEIKSSLLGLMTAPAGILSPDLVTHHFIPGAIPTYEITPYGKLYQTRAHIIYPKSINDVQAIISEAKNSGKSISVLGKLMSQGKQAINNEDWHIAINTKYLNEIEINPINRTARVGAGASWSDLQMAANEFGLAVRVMQASNVFSIGGSISVNCHGWDYKTGSVRNTILKLTIVDAIGNVQTLTPDDPLFNYVVGGYGGFGVIVEALISLTDNVQMIESGVEISPENYVAYFVDHIRDNPDIDMHLYRLSLDPKNLFQTGISVTYQKVSDQPFIAPLQDEPAKGSRIDRIKIHTLRRVKKLRKYAWNVEKKNAIEAHIATRNELMRPPINPIFNNSSIDTEWLQEYFVKGAELPGFLVYLSEVLEKNNVALFNASVRFVKADSLTKLSYAPDEDRFAVVLFFNQKLSPKEIQKTKAWVQEVTDYLIKHEGIYYLPYQQFATVEQFNACYSQASCVRQMKNQVDLDRMFDNGLYADYILVDKHEPSLFRNVFNRVTGQREEVKAFLNNVFMQLDEEKFFPLVDSILEDRSLSDEQIYQVLAEKIYKAQPNTFIKLKHTLESLNALKNDLGNQTAHLIGEKEIQGYVEIGYPGRMISPLKNRIKIKGPFYAISDQERFSDYVEAGFPRPYDRFIPINDYEPIAESAIPSESVDLVCMYIGLHHIPQERLDAFIDSIKRILRPEGTFILMDHDAHTKELVELVDVVHSIFNAATGVDPETNRNEVRNFHALQYWTDRLSKHGFTAYEHAPLMRRGDSTLNSVIRFDKAASEKVEVLILTPEEKRAAIQTYLTAPEWQNVRAAKRYAEFVKDRHACQFPYFQEIGGFWKVYGDSYNAARKEHSFSDVVFSDYNLMNLFVGTSMSIEYGIKGVISAPLAIADQTLGTNQPIEKTIPTDLERVRSLTEYGDSIENTPFYNYPYFKDIGTYWSTYFQQNKTIGSRVKGFFVGSGMTLEYGIKGILSMPMSLIYGSETLKESETTHILVLDPENSIEHINPDIIVLAALPEKNLKHIEVPRYMRCTEILKEIARNSNAECVSISGQNIIQIDVKSRTPFADHIDGMRKLYDIPAPTEDEYIYSALEVDVQNLCKIIRQLERNQIQIVFIHDF